MGSLKSKLGSISKLGSVAKNVGQSVSKIASQKATGALNRVKQTGSSSILKSGTVSKYLSKNKSDSRISTTKASLRDNTSKVVNKVANRISSKGGLSGGNSWNSVTSGSSSSQTNTKKSSSVFTLFSPSKSNRVSDLLSNIRNNTAIKSNGRTAISNILGRKQQSTSGESKNLATDLLKDTIRSVPATIAPSNVFGRLKQRITGAQENVSEGDGVTRANPLGLIGLSTTLGSASQRIQDSFANWKSRLGLLPMSGNATESANNATNQMTSLFSRFSEFSNNLSNKLFGRAQDVEYYDEAGMASEVQNSEVAGAVDDLNVTGNNTAPAVKKEAPVVKKDVPADAPFVQEDRDYYNKLLGKTNEADISYEPQVGYQMFRMKDGGVENYKSTITGVDKEKGTFTVKEVVGKGKDDKLIYENKTYNINDYTWDGKNGDKSHYVYRNPDPSRTIKLTSDPTPQKTNTEKPTQSSHRGEGLYNPNFDKPSSNSGSAGSSTSNTGGYSPRQREKNVTGPAKPIATKNNAATQSSSSQAQNPRARTAAPTPKASTNPRAKANKTPVNSANQAPKGAAGSTTTTTNKNTPKKDPMVTTGPVKQTPTQPKIINKGANSYFVDPYGRVTKIDQNKVMLEGAKRTVAAQEAANPLNKPNSRVGLY